ncbi:MAG: hypothetical protein OJF60_002373 [Burkholderiaceae bacterium]|nr:MAG: hypothetical protein OJF60_002373 [Burkholderiaceae bacterium]
MRISLTKNLRCPGQRALVKPSRDLRPKPWATCSRHRTLIRLPSVLDKTNIIAPHQAGSGAAAKKSSRNAIIRPAQAPKSPVARGAGPI